jgi:general bacterial porin, GBP family
MKTKVAMALATGMAISQASWSQSSVTLYGRIDTDVNYTHFSSAGGKASENGTTMDSDANFFGFKIDEDLGGGLKVVAKLENGFYANNGAFFKSGTLFNRQAYVGLTQSQYGTFLMGQQYAPSFWISVEADPFGRLTNGSIVSLMQQLPGVNLRGFLGSVSNAVQYISPSIHDVQGRLFYAFDSGSAGSDTIGETEAASLKYQSKSLYLSAAYENQRVANTAALPAALSNTTYVFGARYTYKSASIYGYFQRNYLRNQPKVDAYMVGATYLIDPGDELLMSASKRSSPTAETGVKMFAIGYDHFLSSRTTLYASFAHLQNDRNAKFGLWPAVLTYSAEGLPLAGQNETSFEVGIRHYF